MMTLRLVSAIALAALAAQAVLLDRIAVTVGRRVITESQVIRDIRVAAFLDRKPVVINAETKRKAADRLVDQMLILDDAGFSHLTLPSAADGAKLVDDTKKTYPSPQAYLDSLKAYQISEPDLQEHLVAGLRTLRFTDLRFRPEVQISEDDLHDFYNGLLKEWKSKDEKNIPAFDAARPDIERMLTEQRVMQALDRWLGGARTSTEILYRDEAFK